MTSGDRIVVAIVVALALLEWPASVLATGGFAVQKVVTVTAPGHSYAVPLSAERTIDVHGLEGTVTVVVDGGEVAVTEAACPDHICVRQGRVGSGAIVCVPNGVTVRIGGGPDALDAQVR